jgi:hypothetical protein
MLNCFYRRLQIINTTTTTIIIIVIITITLKKETYQCPKAQLYFEHHKILSKEEPEVRNPCL